MSSEVLHKVSEQRSRNISAIKSKNTKPEIAVRKVLHSMGYRFRLHGKDLPGSPDIVLPKYKTVIFVHGCFWHRHQNCSLCYMPKSNQEFWLQKFETNIRRDQRNMAQLSSEGWNIGIVWECSVRAGLMSSEQFTQIKEGKTSWEISAPLQADGELKIKSNSQQEVI